VQGGVQERSGLVVADEVEPCGREPLPSVEHAASLAGPQRATTI
jgi:hypothetical protein